MSPSKGARTSRPRTNRHSRGRARWPARPRPAPRATSSGPRRKRFRRPPRRRRIDRRGSVAAFGGVADALLVVRAHQHRGGGIGQRDLVAAVYGEDATSRDHQLCRAHAFGGAAAALWRVAEHVVDRTSVRAIADSIPCRVQRHGFGRRRLLFGGGADCRARPRGGRGPFALPACRWISRLGGCGSVRRLTVAGEVDRAPRPDSSAASQRTHKSFPRFTGRSWKRKTGPVGVRLRSRRETTRRRSHLRCGRGGRSDLDLR